MLRLIPILFLLANVCLAEEVGRPTLFCQMLVRDRASLLDNLENVLQNKEAPLTSTIEADPRIDKCVEDFSFEIDKAAFAMKAIEVTKIENSLTISDAMAKEKRLNELKGLWSEAISSLRMKLRQYALMN